MPAGVFRERGSSLTELISKYKIIKHVPCPEEDFAFAQISSFPENARDMSG